MLPEWAALLAKEGEVILLESQMEGHPASSKSYLAGRPEATIRAWGNKIRVQNGNEVKDYIANPWEALQSFQNQNKGEWLFGYLGYDLKNGLESLSSNNKSWIDAPDLFFMKPGFLLQADTHGKVAVIKGKPLHTDNKRAGFAQDDKLDLRLNYRIARDEYLGRIDQVRYDIFEGNYYELNLSHPLVYETNADSIKVYSAMKKAGPVPFGAYMNLGDVAVCCASPERFLAREGNRVWSQPIKGTAKRTNGEQEKVIQQLRYSKKEQAENLMIVDLVRNDLARVALNGSVRVPELFDIQSFTTVHQMVSTVACEVDGNQDSVEIIKACFPMGSMTGAPKIAAMKAIEDLENYRRGIYSGAIGYFKPNGDFDFNVVIRTALMQENTLVYPVGGAITSDSESRNEWEETLVKAQAITDIIKKVDLAE